MFEERWNSAKSIAIGAALLLATALVTGVVVANWNGKEPPRPAAAVDGQPGR
jgi:hypothetical protein